MRYLRQNTATIVTVGPFFDKTDGVTIETALTITNERITLVADTDAGSAPTIILDNVTGATSATDNDLNYITNCDAGLMQLELTAANTNRVGRCTLSITDAANHCPVFHEFTILPAQVFDSLILGTDLLDANAVQLGGTTQTGRDLGASVLLSSGTGAGQVSLSSGAVLLQPTQTGVTIPTVTTLTGHTAQSGDAFARIGAPAGASVSADVATLDGRIPAALVGGRMDASVGAVAAGAIAAASFAAGALDAVWSTASRTLTSFGTLAADIWASATRTLTAAADSSGVTTLLGKFSGITLLAQWLGALAGKQAPDATAQTEIRATGAGAGTFDATTDSGEAIRDRGDAAWVTGGGGGTPLSAQQTVDAVLKLAPTAGVPDAGSFGADLEQARYRLDLDGTQTQPVLDDVTGAVTRATSNRLPTTRMLDRRVSQVLVNGLFGLHGDLSAGSVDWLAGTPAEGWVVNIYVTYPDIFDGAGVVFPSDSLHKVLVATLDATGFTGSLAVDQCGVMYVEYPAITPPYSPCALTLTGLFGTRTFVSDGQSGEHMYSLHGHPLKWDSFGHLSSIDPLAGITAATAPQEFRDALKLAPSAGAAAAGSVDALIVAGGGSGITPEQYAALAKESTVLGQFGVTYGITYPLIRRDGTINLSRGDVAPLAFTLSASFPLAGKKVYFCAQKRKAETNATAIVNREATIADEAARTCSITLTAAELASAGQYHYEIEVRNTDESSPQTAEAGTLNIIDDLRK